METQEKGGANGCCEGHGGLRGLHSTAQSQGTGLGLEPVKTFSLMPRHTHCPCLSSTCSRLGTGVDECFYFFYNTIRTLREPRRKRKEIISKGKRSKGTQVTEEMKSSLRLLGGLSLNEIPPLPARSHLLYLLFVWALYPRPAIPPSWKTSLWKHPRLLALLPVKFKLAVLRSAPPLL